MLLDRLKNITLSAGTGENRFTMSRGSFRYRQKIQKMAALEKTGTEDLENGFVVRFALPGSLKDQEDHAVSVFVTEEQGRICVRTELPEQASRQQAALREPSAARSTPNRFRLTLPADPSEHFYGCGETYSEFDLKGQLVRIFVAEHQNTKRISRKIIREKIFGKKPERTLPFEQYESYYAQPTLVSSARYYLHVDTNAYMEFDLRTAGQITLNTQEPPAFFMAEGASFPEVSEKLADLLGRQRELPDWICDGAILAVQGGTETVDRKIRLAKEAGVRVCGIWSQDWCGCRQTGFGYQVMWNWEQDRELYPDLEQKIREWKADGVRFLGYINPFLALEKDLYRTASEHGWCVKDREGKDYLVTIRTFPAAMIDFTNPEAYAWYKSLIKENMIGIGMGGWMADFGEYLPVDCVLASGEDPALIHNRWPAIWAQMNREAIEECGAQDEVFFFTRAGHTGTVSSSAMMWTGDQHVDWSVDDGLPSVIPATLSLAMSGFGVTHSDAGGYTTIMHMLRSKELLLRWLEMNAFSPLLRTHEGNQPANNVQFDADDEVLAGTAAASRVHAALKEYLRAAIKENAEQAHPVMRPLFYHYDEPAAYTEKTEYLLGRDILVAPVTKEGAVSRTVYLPEDRWIHLFTGEVYGGGAHEVPAPVGCPPAFIREESSYRTALSSISLTEGVLP